MRPYVRYPWKPLKNNWDNYLGQRDGLTNLLNPYDLSKISIDLKSQLNPYDLSWVSTEAAG